MSAKRNFNVGDTVSAYGCVTRLIDIINRDPTHLEELIGFHRGRLSRGYYLLLLKEPLAANEFEFFGYTYFSGGKFGLPSNDEAKEAARQSVHDSLLKQMGNMGVYNLAQKVAADIPATGQNRLVKIIPVIGHDDKMKTADQYPASPHGIAQFRLIVEKRFLVSAFVGPDRRFQSGALDLIINEDTGYESRRAVFQYLSRA
ncbi:hypothetical protein [Azospirillum sp. B2RO_4]|uniref:hypothetical protein n=1 Tax=Azospirillum sp. B2RO_4 TaxID=3027796 RepID=UPI003DA8A46F